MSIFSTVPTGKVSRSTHNLSHENKCSFNYGGIYPLLVRKMYPGDVARLACQCFVRTVPLLSPVMHRNDIKLDAFFVPFRLIWNSYDKWFMCLDETLKQPMIYFDNNYITEEAWNKFMGVGSLADYLGFASIAWDSIPGETKDVEKRKLNDLPFRAYNLIYDFYFRNKVLTDSITDPNNSIYYDLKTDSDRKLTPGTPFLSQYTIRNRNWRRDQFTSATPLPQRGPSVQIPQPQIVQGDDDAALILGDEHDHTGVLTSSFNSSGTASVLLSSGEGRVPAFNSDDELHYESGLELGNVPTLEDFRYAEAMEEYMEANSRVGAYGIGAFKEWLYGIWHTKSPDARLDRPEYLGGYRGPIQISEVPQTSEGTDTSAQGTLAGKGLGVGGQRLFRRHRFSEPGILMVTMSIVPRSAYFQGDPREWLYDNCFEEPNPYFAHLGEQEVLSQEISAVQALYNSNQRKVFGYNVRNYEVKHVNDSVHGDLRSSLLYWHEARKFSDDPTDATKAVGLNDKFCQMNPEEVARIFPSIEDSDKFIGEFFFDFKVKTNFPYYGVPRIGR